MDDLITRPRQVRTLHLPSHCFVTLFKGGVYEFSPSLPRDATFAGAWHLPDTLEILLAAESREFGFVSLGELIPQVAPPRVRMVG